MNSFLEFLSGELENRTLPGTCRDILCFIGRPLALSSVKLYVEGKEGFPGLDNDSVPVKIGDIHRPSDGLTGFFKEGEREPYKTLYTYEDPTKTESGYVKYDNHLAVGIGREKRTGVTMLYEPSGEIHVISGILPVKKIKLPEEFAERLLKKLKFRLFVNPVLCSGDGRPLLPLAFAEGKAWSYMTQMETGEMMDNRPVDSSQAAYEAQAPFELREGWLQLREERKEGDE